MTPSGGKPGREPVKELFGRQPELAVLRGWWEEARAGAARFVVCSGEAGIGKSRIAEELAAEAERAGAIVRWARATADPPTPPYWLWRTLVGATGVPPGERDSSDVVPTQPGRFDPATDRLVLFEGVTAALVAEARATGMLVVVDDVQWADPSSLQLLVHLVRHLRGARLLLLATERTPAEAGYEAWLPMAAQLLQEPRAERLALRGIDAGATARLLLESGGTLGTGQEEALHSLTGGNPFFVKQLGAAGYDASQRKLPASVLQLVGHRVGTLSSDTQQFLRAAAVIGDPFSLAVTAAVVDRPVMACLPAVDEALDAGYLAQGGAAGELRFSHGLIRSALQGTLSLTEKVTLHRRAAEAVEATHAGDCTGRSGDLARHWAVVAVTGEWEPAVRWSVRAAEEAADAQGYEDAVGWYRTALDVGGANLDEASRIHILTGLARTRWKAGELDGAREAVAEAIDLAVRAGHPVGAGEALLVLEAIGDQRWDRDLAARAEEVLSPLGEDHAGLRARLLARRAEAAMYAREYAEADEYSGEALALAATSGDAVAEVAALRARQLARTAPEHHDERVELSRRMIAAGQMLRDPATELWGRLWKIDTHWERAELADIGAELSRVEWCADRVGGPVARWHALVPRAALAQAAARFDEALDVAGRAFALMAPIHPMSAFGAYRSLLSVVAHHVGAGRVPPLSESLQPPPPAEGRSGRASIYELLGPAFDLVELGRPEDAAAFYVRLGPPSSWAPEPYFLLPAYACGAMVAAALQRTDHLEELATLLGRYRGRQVVVPAGAGSFLGPVELHLGRIAATLGRHEAAVADLTFAAAETRRSGALGLAVEADCLLASVLAENETGAGRRGATELALEARAQAERLGMHPWARRAASIAGEAGAGAVSAADAALSGREVEVAGLVADGLTNRQIAERLYLSERTAQNHVQHILVKLGFTNRSQIASWVVAHRRR